MLQVPGSPVPLYFVNSSATQDEPVTPERVADFLTLVHPAGEFSQGDDAYASGRDWIAELVNVRNLCQASSGKKTAAKKATEATTLFWDSTGDAKGLHMVRASRDLLTC